MVLDVNKEFEIIENNRIDPTSKLKADKKVTVQEMCNEVHSAIHRAIADYRIVVFETIKELKEKIRHDKELFRNKQRLHETDLVGFQYWTKVIDVLIKVERYIDELFKFENQK